MKDQSMHIWMICQYYKPETGAPSARLSGLAQVFQKHGKSVKVLTSIPNHPKGVIYPGYENRPHVFEEDVEGVLVRRHNFFMTRNAGFAKKTLSHLSFAWNVLRRNLKAEDKPSVIIASSPSFFAAISGWMLSVRYGVPFIMEVRDIWPGIFVELGTLKPGFILSCLEKVELFLYRRAAAVVTVTKGFAKDITSRGIPAEKVFVITNGASEKSIELAEDAVKIGQPNSIKNELQINPLTRVVLYIGTHGQSQALGQIIDAARILMSRSDILFLFVGDGADKPRLQRLAKGMPNVQFVGVQPNDKVWGFYKMAFINLVPLKAIEGFKNFIPSKMFEVMAAKAPMIGCLEGEGADIINASGNVTVPPEDPEKLAVAIQKMVDNPTSTDKMGAAGLNHLQEHYTHTKLGEKYLGVLEKIAKN